MIKKGLALEAAGLREDELELEVPPYLVAGRLGGAHSLQRISGRALACLAAMDLWEEEALSAILLPGGVPACRFRCVCPGRLLGWAGRCV